MADIRAALGLLARLDAEPGARMHKALDLGRVALAGHSFGGAVAAEAMRLDQGVRAGVNLDGTMLGRVVDTGLDRPFLLVGSDGHRGAGPQPGPPSGHAPHRRRPSRSPAPPT